MDSGAVPPPRRRSAPRSLLVPPPQPPPVATTASGGPNSLSQFSNEPPEAALAHLQAALASEQRERERLASALREESARLRRSQQQQTQLEAELVARDASLSSLTGELRLLKQKKQLADSDLAQSTADYLNSQTKWLEQVDQLNDEIHQLKARLAGAHEDLASAQSSLVTFQQREAKELAERKRREQRAQRPDNVQVAADELEKHQNELLIRELQACHAKLRQEIQEIREVNERLRDDNEHYQYLLVENTIKNGEGGTDPEAGRPEVEPAMTLADDEVLYDLKAMQDPSIVDEDSLSSLESTESLQKAVNRQQFELRSLANHNRALKLSLERLVDRLLENKSFSQAVEESVSSASVQRFRSRVASNYSERGVPSLDSLTLKTQAGSRQGSVGSVGSSAMTAQSQIQAQPQPQAQASPTPAAAWSNMIFNSQYTGTPSRRVFSLGVDTEFRPPPPPSPLSISSEKTLNTTPIKYAFGHPRIFPTRQGSVENPPDGGELRVAKRTDNLKGMRKLRLAD